MSAVVTLLVPEHIELDVRVADKAGLFRHIAERGAVALGVPARTVEESLQARESMGSTALGLGVAIPHGRVRGAKQAACFFLRLAPALEFDAPDRKPVQLVFALLVPLNADELHLQLLGELAEHLGSAGFRDTLATAPDAAAVRKALGAG